MTVAALLSACPGLRYHQAATREERHAAREECCRRYGRAEIDRGQLWRYVRQEIEALALARGCG